MVKGYYNKLVPKINGSQLATGGKNVTLLISDLLLLRIKEFENDALQISYFNILNIHFASIKTALNISRWVSFMKVVELYLGWYVWDQIYKFITIAN